MKFICPESGCNREFDSKYGLGAHKRWHSKEYRKKMLGKNHPRGMLGKHHLSESKKKMSDKMRGRRVTDETKKKLSDASRGRVVSEETKRKIGDSSRKDNNDIGYEAIHLRAHRIDPKPKDGICAYCHKIKDKYENSKLEHSNKDHFYRLPINPDEWQWIHHSCHMKYDIEKNLNIS